MLRQNENTTSQKYKVITTEGNEKSELAPSDTQRGSQWIEGTASADDDGRVCFNGQVLSLNKTTMKQGRILRMHMYISMYHRPISIDDAIFMAQWAKIKTISAASDQTMNKTDRARLVGKKKKGSLCRNVKRREKKKGKKGNCKSGRYKSNSSSGHDLVFVYGPLKWKLCSAFVSSHYLKELVLVIYLSTHNVSSALTHEEINKFPGQTRRIDVVRPLN